MAGRLERLVLKWLRAVAPEDWTDSVVGDLREDLSARGGASRARTLAALAGIGLRFTIESLSARLRATRRRPWRRHMDLRTDLRQAARGLARTPGFTFVAVLTLALAIGANTAIYSALSSLVLNPLPFKDGNRFVLLWRFNAEMGNLMVTPPAELADRWREATHLFDAVESYWGGDKVMTGRGEPEAVQVTMVGPRMMDTVSVQPVAGRAFAAADFEPAADPVVLISHGVWQSRFGGDETAIGSSVTLDGVQHAIVGVMPARFALPMDSGAMWGAARRGVDTPEYSVRTIAKLAPGVAFDAAQAAFGAIPATTDGKDEGWTGRLMPAGDLIGSGVKSALFVLSGAVGLLLLIACVNVANLMLTRHGARGREIALRHALGASRVRLARFLLIESAVVAVAGGLAGLAIAHGALSLIAALRPARLDALDRLSLDPQVLAFAAGASLVTAVLFGIVPALTSSRAKLQDVLKSGGRTATAPGQRVRRVLTVAQVALALILLVGAGLLLRSYGQLMAVDLGFDPAGVLSVKASLPEARYPSKNRAARGAFYEQALASIAAVPGVRAAAIGMGVPLDAGISFGTIEFEGRPDATRNGLYVGGRVTPSYFPALSIRLLEGHRFTADDHDDDVVIVGRSFARASWPDRGALGQRLRLAEDGAWLTVIGVVDDVKQLSLTSSEEHPQLYLPLAPNRANFGSLIVKADGDPRALIPAIKAAIWRVDEGLPLDEIATAEQIVSRAASQARFNLALLGAFAVCGLVLAVVGVYGVTALYLGQRQREVGIRMALGATRSSVAALVFRQTTLLIMVAIVAGGLGAWWLSRYLESLVFATATTDAVTYVAAAGAIVIASLAATLVPVRRATSVDPAIVLRAE